MEKARCAPSVLFREPSLRDGAEMWRLVKASRPLDLNSCYAYLLLCHHFSETCVVAERGEEMVGFVSAYVPPSTPETIFVWQVAVRAEMRGRGLATSMLIELLRRRACRGAAFLEATVSPSNEASWALFHALARRLGAGCEKKLLFPRGMFGEEGHEEEVLFRIGPFHPQEVYSWTS
jgi:L-2,4-diaminobutyric acid acetyltransferase